MKRICKTEVWRRKNCWHHQAAALQLSQDQHQASWRHNMSVIILTSLITSYPRTMASAGMRKAAAASNCRRKRRTLHLRSRGRRADGWTVRWGDTRPLVRLVTIFWHFPSWVCSLLVTRVFAVCERIMFGQINHRNLWRLSLLLELITSRAFARCSQCSDENLVFPSDVITLASPHLERFHRNLNNFILWGRHPTIASVSWPN